MKLVLLSIEKEGYIRIGSEGSITSDDFTSGGKNPLESIIGPAWASNRVLLDMEKNSYFDPSAIGWLINCHKEFKKSGGVLVVHSIPPKVEQVLNLLKIGKVLPLASNEHTAKALLSGASA